MSGVYLIRTGSNWFKLDSKTIRDQRAKKGWADAADIVYNYEGGYFVRADDKSVTDEYIRMIIFTHGGIEDFPEVPISYYPGGIGFV